MLQLHVVLDQLLLLLILLYTILTWLVDHLGLELLSFLLLAVAFLHAALLNWPLTVEVAIRVLIDIFTGVVEGLGGLAH